MSTLPGCVNVPLGDAKLTSLRYPGHGTVTGAVQNDPPPTVIDCPEHSRQPAAVVCQHLVDRSTSPLGFVENSSDPTDRQAWCERCEELFIAQGSRMTETVRRFHGMKVVCARCYENARRAHAHPE